MNIKACISKHQIGRGETTALGVGEGGGRNVILRRDNSARRSGGGGNVILGHTW